MTAAGRVLIDVVPEGRARRVGSGPGWEAQEKARKANVGPARLRCQAKRSVDVRIRVDLFLRNRKADIAPEDARALVVRGAGSVIVRDRRRVAADVTELLALEPEFAGT